MRLFAKIYLFGTVILSIAFLISGYFLMNYFLKTSLEREMEFALKQYQYDKFSVQSNMLADENVFQNFTEVEPILWESVIEDVSNPVAFFDAEGKKIYSKIDGVEPSFVKRLSEDSHTYQFMEREGHSYIVIGSTVSLGEKSLLFMTRSDISKVIGQRETIQTYFRNCYCISLIVGMILMLFMSFLLTKPLKQMSKAAGRIAGGDYRERLSVSGRDEMGELAESFNRMAIAVEDKVEALSDAAKQKEDFVANFAHELKTPLASMIGYADMIYQKELSREEIKKASAYIWNEGMRLEALSHKLLELTVLNKQEFPLIWLPADELLGDVVEGLRPVLESKQVDFQLEAGNGYIRADYDLLKTLILNLVDNSIKAGGTKLSISGKYLDGQYQISICDNGCGIPADDLSRITEAFYMVDKSRSRKQHGVGLGLTLAEKITHIHGGELKFESEEGKGTKVLLYLESKKGEEFDER